MKFLPVKKADFPMNMEAVTYDNNALFAPTEVGDFATLVTESGNVRTRIMSIETGKYTGMVLECPNAADEGKLVVFEQKHILIREKPVTEF